MPPRSLYKIFGTAAGELPPPARRIRSCKTKDQIRRLQVYFLHFSAGCVVSRPSNSSLTRRSLPLRNAYPAVHEEVITQGDTVHRKTPLLLPSKLGTRHTDPPTCSAVILVRLLPCFINQQRLGGGNIQDERGSYGTATSLMETEIRFHALKLILTRSTGDPSETVHTNAAVSSRAAAFSLLNANHICQLMMIIRREALARLF